MKIIYLGDFSPYTYNSEKKINNAFKSLGHEVIQIDERDWDLFEIVEKCKSADLFLFHKGVRFGRTPRDLLELLLRVPCKKAFWWFDPVEEFQGRAEFLQTIIPFVDYGFMTNETYIRRNNYDNLIVLRQGFEPKKKGKKRKEYECDVAFTGSIYGSRQILVNGLKKNYGDRFKHFTSVHDQDFRDVCASAKIMIAPKFPSNDFYWSNRIYETLGAGGFLIHPKCEGLKKEYEEYKHFVPYVDGDHLKYLIDYYLEHPKEREQIRKAGQKYTIKNYTYKKRCQELINKSAY